MSKKTNDLNHRCEVCGSYPARYWRFLRKAVCDKCFDAEFMKWLKATTIIIIPVAISIFILIKYL